MKTGGNLQGRHCLILYRVVSGVFVPMSCFHRIRASAFGGEVLSEISCFFSKSLMSSRGVQGPHEPTSNFHPLLNSTVQDEYKTPFKDTVKGHTFTHDRLSQSQSRLTRQTSRKLRLNCLVLPLRQNTARLAARNTSTTASLPLPLPRAQHRLPKSATTDGDYRTRISFCNANKTILRLYEEMGFIYR